MSVNIDNNSILFKNGPLAGRTLHPLWLRERLTDEKNLDPNNFQRLYEPSLLDKDPITQFFHPYLMCLGFITLLE